MKKIVCFTYCLGAGGAERQLISLASFLQEEGYDVKLLTFVRKEFYRDLIDKLSVPYECVDTPHNRFFHLIHLYKRFKEINPDIVIAYLGVPSMIACGIKMLGLKFKLICSERTTTHPIRRIDKVRCVLYKYADYIVPNSETQAKIISSYRPKLERKIKVINNYTDTIKFAPSKNVKDNTVLRVVSVGRIYEPKNIIRYIKAVSIIHREYKNIVFEWYGVVDNKSYFEKCSNKIIELGLDSVFLFKGTTNSIDVVYKNADVFCLPSLFEGYPNVICEAMSSGLPILCSNVCDNPTIVKEGENAFLFDPQSEEDIANSLKKVLSLSLEGKKEMGQKSRLLAESQFSKKEFINSYKSLF